MEQSWPAWEPAEKGRLLKVTAWKWGSVYESSPIRVYVMLNALGFKKENLPLKEDWVKIFPNWELCLLARVTSLLIVCEE